MCALIPAVTDGGAIFGEDIVKSAPQGAFWTRYAGAASFCNSAPESPNVQAGDRVVASTCKCYIPAGHI